MKAFNEHPEIPYLEMLGYYLSFVHTEEAEDDPQRRFYVNFTTGKQNPSDQDSMRPRELGKTKFINIKTRWQGTQGFIYGTHHLKSSFAKARPAPQPEAIKWSELGSQRDNQSDNNTVLLGLESRQFQSKSQYILGYQRRLTSSLIFDVRKSTSDIESVRAGIAYRPMLADQR